MASQVKLIQNIAGGLSRSQLVKVGLGDSLNMFPEMQSQNEHSCAVLVRSVCGERGFSGRLDGECRGLYRVSRGVDGNPALYGVFGNVLYLFQEDGTAEVIQRIDTSGTECRMVETGGYGNANPHLVIVDGTNCYAVPTTVPVATQRHDFRTIALPERVTSSDELIKPTHCAYLYGYLIVNDEGSDAFYTSIQYPGETLDSNNNVDYDWFRLASTANKGFITYSEWCPDNTTALISNGSRLLTLGPRSWQLFSYNNDKLMPFTSPDNAAGNIGIKAPNSLAMLGHTALWLGASDIGENGVFCITGDEIKRVSTSDLEREFAMMQHPENAYASIWQEHRHTFYSLTFEDSKMTYVYDIGEGAWHRRASYDDKNNLTFWRYNHATFAYNRTMVASGSDLCYMDENEFQEHDGRPILKMRRGCVLTNDDKPFYIDSLEIVGNQGQHTVNLFELLRGEMAPNDQAEGVNPRVSIRYSWDGATFSDYEDYFLGKQGEYEWNTVVWQCGLGKYFTLEISTTEKIPFCIQNLKVEYSPAGNFT